LEALVPARRGHHLVLGGEDAVDGPADPRVVVDHQHAASPRVSLWLDLGHSSILLQVNLGATAGLFVGAPGRARRSAPARPGPRPGSAAGRSGAGAARAAPARGCAPPAPRAPARPWRDR